MATKSSQARLTIPKSIWDMNHFENFAKDSFGFFVSNDSRVVITSFDVCEHLNYEFLGKCTFDEKHRFFVPHNVDDYLGEGDIYYFTSSLQQNVIYFYKTNAVLLSKLQQYHLQLLVNSL